MQSGKRDLSHDTSTTKVNQSVRFSPRTTAGADISLRKDKRDADTSRSPPRFKGEPSGISPRDAAHPSSFSAASAFGIDQNVPENEAGVKATSKRPGAMTDKELFGMDGDGEGQFLTDELTKQYHEHLRKKEEIRQRIEGLAREKSFLERMNPDDVAYMF